MGLHAIKISQLVWKQSLAQGARNGHTGVEDALKVAASELNADGQERR